MVAYVALLRGIAPTNPKMHGAELARVFDGLGFGDVRTVISSGNVLFTTPDRAKAKLEARIEVAMREHLGSPCSTIIRSATQIERLLGLDTFDSYDDGPAGRCNVTFLKRRPPPGVSPPADGSGYVIFPVVQQAVFSVIDTTQAKTPDLMIRLESAFGKEITTRTWKTVHRIARAFDDDH